MFLIMMLFWANILALLFSFFVAGLLLGALFSKTVRERIAELVRHPKFLKLARSLKNPILTPGRNLWTAEAVLNPAAAVLGGRTHLIFRAVGADGVSRLGYASSSDGVVFDKRLPYPVYVAQKPRDLPGHLERKYSMVLYPSGGSWGGCEDPRMVVIEGRVYVTFNMFDGWDFIRVAAISIDERDLLAERFWKWDGPHILSRPGERQKNWVLFPEKINGKYAVLHSIAPKIEVAYRNAIEDIGTEEPFIDSWVGSRDSLPPREGVWDTHVRGAGPPPLKTDKGWLVLYHAIDARDPGRYKLGAMLLDLDDPAKELHRGASPVLAPDETYENHGKPGIVYACGAVVRDGTLYVYYGGADKVICVATADLETFLHELITGVPPELDSMTKAEAS